MKEADDPEVPRVHRRAPQIRTFPDILQLLFREGFTGKLVIHFYQGRPKKAEELGAVRRFEVLDG